MNSSEDTKSSQDTQSAKQPENHAHRPTFKLVVQTDSEVVVLYARNGFRVDSFVNNGETYAYKRTRLYGAMAASGVAKMRGMGKCSVNLDSTDPATWLTMTDEELVKALNEEMPWTSMKKTSDRLKKASQQEQGPGTEST